MKCALSTVAAISLFLGSASLALPQDADHERAVIDLRAIAALTLAQGWQDWRHDGPQNAGVCLLGSIERVAVGAQISTIRSVVRVARLSGCTNERTIGAAIFTPTGLFEPAQLEELACAAVRGHEQWVVFGIITGIERRLLETGEVLTVAQGLWCTTVKDRVEPRLAALPPLTP